jgi:crossover junction endodeoxyribonuclease RuvC
MIVLGIDPGTAQTGFGAVSLEGSRLRALEHGVVTTPAAHAPAERLAVIFDHVAELIDRLRPDAVALEDLFVGKNPRTILTVGQARGAILAACGRAGVEACGYAPAEIKTSVCGYGRADKQQVMRMVTAMLSLEQPPASDHAADALAAAVCHARVARSRATLAGARR